jgi:hypothetical protein
MDVAAYVQHLRALHAEAPDLLKQKQKNEISECEHHSFDVGLCAAFAGRRKKRKSMDVIDLTHSKKRTMFFQGTGTSASPIIVD